MRILLLYPPPAPTVPTLIARFLDREDRGLTQPSCMFSHGPFDLALCSASAQADPIPSLNPSSLSPKQRKSPPTVKERTLYFPVISVEWRSNWGLALQVHHSNYNRLQAPRLSRASHKVVCCVFGWKIRKSSPQ